MHISTIEITSKKVRGNHVDFSTSEITSKKVRGNHVDFSTSEITSKKVRGNHVDFSTIEITSKKVRGNHVNFSTSEITSKKVRGNHADFSTIETTSKKYAEMTWKFAEIWSSTYRRNIDAESTWIRHGLPVGYNVLLKDVCETLQNKLLQRFIGTKFWKIYRKTFAVKKILFSKIALSN